MQSFSSDFHRSAKIKRKTNTCSTPGFLPRLKKYDKLIGLNKLNGLATVLLLPLCDQARPWFRFSTRTSSVAGLAFCLVASTRATVVICSVRLFVLL